VKFEFDEDQEAIRTEVRRFLSKECTSRTVRNVLESDQLYDAPLWRAMGEMGWTAIALPEEYGGQGAGHLELCVIAEELGRALAPVPFSSSVYLASEAMMMAGDAAQKADWLPKLASAKAIGALAVAEGPGVVPWGRCQVSAQADAAGHFRLTGVKSPVADGLAADLLIVSAQGPDGVGLYLVEADRTEVTRSPEPGLDESRPLARIEFKGALAQRLGTSSAATIQELLNRAAVLFAFEQLGGADACLRMAVDYAKQRFAFGRPIGSFQAIKHKLADMFGELELARSNCFYAAWALSTNDASLAEAAACARLSVSQAYFICAKECVQTHGGIGFTWELDAHLYYRRAKALAAVIGGQARWREALIGTLEKKLAA
jgi:acyl-CoA dehydrogenase